MTKYNPGDIAKFEYHINDNIYTTLWLIIGPCSNRDFEDNALDGIMLDTDIISSKHKIGILQPVSVYGDMERNFTKLNSQDNLNDS